MHWPVDGTNPQAAVDRVYASLVSSIVLTHVSYHTPYPHSTQPERRKVGGGNNSARVKTTCGKNEARTGGRLLVRLFRAAPRLPLPLHWHSATPSHGLTPVRPQAGPPRRSTPGLSVD